MIYFGKSHKGLKRKNNEDRIFLSDQIGPLKNIFIVADGLGGHKAGEIASSMSIKFFCEFIKKNSMIYTQDFLGAALEYANTNVYIKSLEKEEFSGMGTTLTCASFDDNNLYYAHAGDSRIYIIKNNNLVQISQDHSYYNELLMEGWSIDDIENRNDKYKLTRAIGTDRKIKIDTGFLEKKDISYVLLCTDGLTDMIKDSEILEIIEKSETIEKSIDNLINRANDLGGYDNISLILMQNEVK